MQSGINCSEPGDYAAVPSSARTLRLRLTKQSRPRRNQSRTAPAPRCASTTRAPWGRGLVVAAETGQDRHLDVLATGPLPTVALDAVIERVALDGEPSRLSNQTGDLGD